MMQAVLQETLEAEFARFLHAAPYERTAARQDVRNGRRPRFLTTRLGKVELRIPRDRGGAFLPTIFARYRRHEQAMLTRMVERGLHGVAYVVSDEQAGLRTAPQRDFPEAVAQRCHVHYLRNALSKVTAAERQAALLEGLRNVWAAPTRAEAERRGAELMASLRPTLPALADWLEESLHETLGFCALPEAEARRRLRTTNAAERVDLADVPRWRAMWPIALQLTMEGNSRGQVDALGISRCHEDSARRDEGHFDAAHVPRDVATWYGVSLL